jgi:hypothetical protein
MSDEKTLPEMNARLVEAYCRELMGNDAYEKLQHAQHSLSKAQRVVEQVWGDFLPEGEIPSDDDLPGDDDE